MKKYAVNFNFIASILNVWLMGGLFLDGWAHEHIKQINTFFTPWHGLYYLGFFLVSFNILLFTFLKFTKTRNIKTAYPPNYGSAFLGIIIFSLSGIGDVIWHGFYGFEVSIEALVSPTHLGLYLGMFLIFIAPFASLLQEKTDDKSIKYKISLILSTAIIFSYMTFLTQYANPLISPFAFNTHRTSYKFYHESIGLVSLFFHMTFLIAPVLMAVAYKKLPLGSISAIIMLNAIGMTAIHDHRDFLISAFLAGLVGDFILYWIKPSFKNQLGFQLFSFLIPAIYTGFYFLVGIFSRGIWWIPQLWIGAIFMTGFFGWLISVLLLFPTKRDQ